MSTEVILTGTGMPTPNPDRAGPGVLVQSNGINLQFDAGRATSMRLAALGVNCFELAAVFVTHHHSDHLLGLQDLAMSRPGDLAGVGLVVVAPEGPSADFARHVLDVWQEDLAVRQLHGQYRELPRTNVLAFQASPEAREVWRSDPVLVSAISVRHQPVEPAVAFRVDTPHGAVVISGDTRVCPEVESLSRGARVLVHEAFCVGATRGTRIAAVANYHADTIELGAMAQRAEVPTLMLTHLIPPPKSAEEEQQFESDVRQGGYTGEVIVGRDLSRISLT